MKRVTYEPWETVKYRGLINCYGEWYVEAAPTVSERDQMKGLFKRDIRGSLVRDPKAWRKLKAVIEDGFREKHPPPGQSVMLQAAAEVLKEVQRGRRTA